MHFLAVAAALTMLFPAQDELKVEVHRQRPSKVMKWLQQGVELLPQGVQVSADDEKSVLIFRGPQKDLQYLGQTVALFDVEARKVRFDYTVTSPLDKMTFEGSITLSNNVTHTFTENGTGLKLSLTPRIHDDGSISVSFSYTCGAVVCDGATNVKSADSTSLPLFGRQAELAKARKAPTVTFKVRILDK
jgi:type II secretory pathway component GspD/PulD (secretin)